MKFVLKLSSSRTTNSSMFAKNDEFCIQNDEFCIQNDELCIQNDELCIQNDELCIQNVELWKVDATDLDSIGLKPLEKKRLLAALAKETEKTAGDQGKKATGERRTREVQTEKKVGISEQDAWSKHIVTLHG